MPASGIATCGASTHAAFADFVTRFPLAANPAARMLLIDRLVHAVHTSGGPAARNLLEGHPRRVLAILDELAGVSAPEQTSADETE